MLEPLKQFVCDKCRQVIEKPEHGWIEWESKIDPVSRKHIQWGFKIVHEQGYSPMAKNEGCSFYEQSTYSSDMNMTDFMGEYQIPEILSFLDVGPYHDPNYSGASVTNMREFVEFVRRLTIPYYEEARIYWLDAVADGYFADADQVQVYLSKNLQNLISKYER